MALLRAAWAHKPEVREKSRWINIEEVIREFPIESRDKEFRNDDLNSHIPMFITNSPALNF